jgi:hypothetical protein
MRLPSIASDHLHLPLLAALLIASLPCLAAGQSQSDATPPQVPITRPEPTGLIHEPSVVLRGIDFATRTIGDGSDRKNGVRLVTSTGLTGAGWISGGGGYRQWMFSDRAIFDASAAVSWRLYKSADARFEFTKLARSRLAVGSEVRWQDLTQITYFGAGPDSSRDNRSQYRFTSSDVVAYATVRPFEWLAINGDLGWMHRPNLRVPGGAFKRAAPPVAEVFPDDPAFARAQQPNFVHQKIAITADTRDYRSHPAAGGVYHVSVNSFFDRDGGTFTNHQFAFEGAQFVPLHDRVVFAVHGSLVMSETAAGHSVPTYLLPSLGGHTSLRGYIDQRFNDRNAVVINLEERIAILTHLDLAAFFDAGNVAARPRDLTFSRMSYGIALSMHSRRATFARVDIAHGDEGWLLGFRTSDPFHLVKLTLRTVSVPVAR